MIRKQKRKYNTRSNYCLKVSFYEKPIHHSGFFDLSDEDIKFPWDMKKKNNVRLLPDKLAKSITLGMMRIGAMPDAGGAWACCRKLWFIKY